MPTLLPLFIISLGHFFCDFMLGIWPLYKTMEEIDLVDAGLIYGVSALIGEGSQLFFGSLSDRGWRKEVVMGGLILTSAALFFPFTNDVLPLFFIFLVTCLGSGAFHPSASGLVSSLTENRKSLYMTFFATFGFIGMAVSQVVFVFVYRVFSSNVLILGLPLLLFLFLIPILQDRAKSERKKRGRHLFSHFFRHKGLRQLYLLQVAIQSISWATIFLLPDVLKGRGYEEWLVYGGGHLLYISGGACMLIPSGLVADWFSTKRVIQGGLLVGSAAFFGFLLNPELPTVVAAILLFMVGASISSINPVSVALGNKVVPHHPGAISSFLMGAVWAVSEIIGPGGGALLATLFSSDGAGKALLLLGLFFPCALFSSLFLPEEVADEALQQVE